MVKTNTKSDINAMEPVVTSFFIPGVPRPKGSSQIYHTKRGKLYTAPGSKYQYEWENTIRDTILAEKPELNARPLYDQSPLQQDYLQPVGLQLIFKLTPIKAYRTHATSCPDIDKLTRCTLDALTKSHLIHDDRQIVYTETMKQYAENPGEEGVHITITTYPLTDDQQLYTMKRKATWTDYLTFRHLLTPFSVAAAVKKAELIELEEEKNLGNHETIKGEAYEQSV